MPGSRCTKAFLIPIVAPTSTTTAAACRSSRSSASPTCDRRRRAAEFFERLRDILVWLGVNDGNMEEGSLRCDANVSVRPAGRRRSARRPRSKNLNSFRYLQKALEYEIERQIDVARGRRARRAGNAAVGLRRAGETLSMRSKEEAHDYRYFPEPDLATAGRRRRRASTAVRGTMPELPGARRQRFVAAYGLPAYDAGC